MLIRAENDPRFSRRFLFMGIIAFGFALWCLKDALISYPAERARAFDEFKAVSKSLFDDPGKKSISREEFEAHANKEGRDAWSQYVQEGDIPGNVKIIQQYYMAGIASMAGLFLLSIPLRRRNRWIELD